MLGVYKTHAAKVRLVKETLHVILLTLVNHLHRRNPYCEDVVLLRS